MKYDSVQLMRGVAAISVVFQHIGMFGAGAFGVDLFFCISGFIMMHVTEKSGKNFLIKRAVRIIPLYWLSVFATAALLIIAPRVFKTLAFTPQSLVKTLLFIPTNTPTHALSAVGWTLVLEVFFYLVFFIATKISHKNRHLIATGILIGLVLLGLFWNGAGYFLRFYGGSIMLEFPLGMFAYKFLTRASKTYDPPLRSLSFIYIGCAAAIWAALFIIARLPVLGSVDRLFIFGLPSLIVFILLFKAFRNMKVPRPLVVLGNISYSLYLTHTFVIDGVSRLIYNIDSFSPAGLAITVVAVLPLTIAVALVSWYLIENRFTNFLRKKLKV